MKFSLCLSVGLVAALAMSSIAHGGSITATFDDLPALPTPLNPIPLQDANNGSPVYHGIAWDSGFSVASDEYRTGGQGGTPPQPVFGIPHSGHYFATNQNNGSVTITTNLVLTGAWFGRNEYYGYGGGAAINPNETTRTEHARELFKVTTFLLHAAGCKPRSPVAVSRFPTGMSQVPSPCRAEQAGPLQERTRALSGR